MALPQVAFIGSGNLAWHLASALDNVGYVVGDIYSATPDNAKSLAHRLRRAEVQTSLDFSTSTATVFIIAVTDDAVQSVARDLVLPERAILLHTSGSLPLSVLECAATPHIGILYPLQTFSKTREIDFKHLPLFFESSTEKVENEIVRMAEALESGLRKTSFSERKILHIAAVFASNFVNHMLAVSYGLLRQNNLDCRSLVPLVMETVAKGLAMEPYKAQTGPAVRGDAETIKNHAAFLEDEPLTADMYKSISQHITSMHTER